MSGLSEATLYDWDVERMVIWLREEHLHDCVKPFSLKKINGISFLNLTEFDIKTFQISQESKRKLTKVLKRMKAKKKSRSFSNSSAEIVEPKRPSAIPAHIDLHEDGEIDVWGSDFSDDEYEREEDDSGSDGEYIEPEEDESQNKEAPNVPTGLVAQLRAGLSGSFKAQRAPAGQSNPQTAPVEEDEEIYDIPPDEEEFYEQPSDDSGSGVVVRPMDKKKVIRCPSSEPGDYIDFRAPKYVDKDDTAEPPPPPGRPPKPGQKLMKPRLPPQPPPPTELEIYDEVPEDEQPGCSQVISESPGGVEVYEPWENDGPSQQETYEIADPNGPQDFYEVPDSEEPETYEVPEQEQPEQETYEVPDPEPAPPARPPPRGTGWNPLKKSPDKGKPALFNKPVEQKQGKPAPPTKPQISAKPSPPPNPALEKKRSSRLYPNSLNTGPSKSPSPTKRQSAALPAPTPKVLSPPPPQQTTPAKKEENNNERKVSNEILKPSSSPRLPLARGQLPSASEDDAPPPPPRPGPKRGQGIPRFPAKPPSISDSDPPVGEPVPPSPLRKTPLPPLPSQPKSPVGQLKNSPWFHGALDKKIAESALKSFSKEGSFIVRNSSKDPNNYAMSLYFKGNVKHLRMPKTNNKYVLGDSGKVEFDNIEELVKYYSQHQVDLKSGGSTSLTDACPVKL